MALAVEPAIKPQTASTPQMRYPNCSWILSVVLLAREYDQKKRPEEATIERREGRIPAKKPKAPLSL